jgi:FPC/CPF motif-containing protein YcgG
MSTETRPGGRASSGAAPQTDDVELERVLDEMTRSDLAHAPSAEVAGALERMVGHPEFPCLGAKSVFRRGSVEHVVLDDMTSADVPDELLARLRRFAGGIEGEPGFHSFIATFRQPMPTDEATFERELFDLLQRLHDADEEPWAPGVGSDPTDPHFAFSAGGTAYFIVGLHPSASRVARRAPLPTLVFNPHDQFEQLREEGRFDRMRGAIRRRDEDLQGTINPMVADYGEATEAVQYSGRVHGPGWEPPLEVRDGDGTRAGVAGHGAHPLEPTDNPEGT